MSRIYDSSAITQRRKNMAQAGSFINRIQSSTNPQTSYGPLQGIYDASIIHSIKMGQPKEFYRNNGCIIISNGCPCSPIAINEITSGPTPPIILAPGSVRNIQLIYGSVIVTWEVSNTGGTSTSYTVTATATGQTTVTHQGITDLTYTFATIELMSGNLYTITVIGVNSAGNGAIYDGSNPTIDAPYLKPTYTTNTPTSTGVTISYSSYVAFLPALGTLFNSTGISIGTSTADATTFIITSGLSSETAYNNCYVRLTNGTNTSSNSDTFSFTTTSPPPPTYPAPNVTNQTTGEFDVSIDYDTYTTFTVASGILYSNQGTFSAYSVSDNQMSVNGLSSGTYYDGCYITLTDGSNTSDNSNTFQFTTQGGPPTYPAPNVTNQTTGEFEVSIDYDTYTTFTVASGILYSNQGTFSAYSINDNQMSVNGLSSGTYYDGCYITLSDGSNTSDNSNTFSFTTTSPPPPTYPAPNVLSVDPSESIVTINYETYTAFPVASGTLYTNQGKFSASRISDILMTVDGLLSGTSYSSCYITLTDTYNTYTSDPSNTFDFTTKGDPSYPAPVVTSQTAREIEVSIDYDTYTAFTPLGGTLYTADQGIFSAYSISDTQMSVNGLSSVTYYYGCYITLTDGSNNSNASNTFDFSTN